MTLALPVLPRINDYLDHHTAQAPDAQAVCFNDDFLSYGELRQQVEHTARALHGLGLQKGERLAVLSTPRPEFLVIMLAAWRIGVIFVGLNPRYTWREIAHVVNDSQPSALLSIDNFEGRDYLDIVARVRTEFPFIRRSFRLESGPPAGVLEPLDALLALAGQSDATDFAARQAGVGGPDPAVIVYTSGSSGAPKGAVLPHRGLVYGPRVAAGQLGIARPRVLCNMPINHVACVSDLCSSILIAGGMIAFDQRFDPARQLELIEKLRLTSLMHVPTVLQMCLAHPDLKTRDLSSLKLVAWGGAALSIEAIRAFRSMGLKMLVFYGMTETICNVTWADESYSDEQLSATIGRPDPNVHVRLVDENLNDVPDGAEGEILVRHEALMLGYFNRPDANAQVFTVDGFMRTGDVAVRNVDGTLRLVGRRSEMYKSGGYNVYPREIELVLEEHPAVALAAVVGVPDPVYQEVGVAWLILRRGAQPVDTGQMRDWCRDRLANYKIPKRFEWREELPLLPVGKVDKQQLKRIASESA